jgi:hypothetical protein
MSKYEWLWVVDSTAVAAFPTFEEADDILTKLKEADAQDFDLYSLHEVGIMHQDEFNEL